MGSRPSPGPGADSRPRAPGTAWFGWVLNLRYPAPCGHHHGVSAGLDFYGHRVTGVDISRVLINHARQLVAHAMTVVGSTRSGSHPGEPDGCPYSLRTRLVPQIEGVCV